MFGTLRIDRHRLSPAARAAYRAAFCSSCHALRDLGGRPASLLTNYDQTVLAVVLAGLAPGDAPPASRRVGAPCTALPWRTVVIDELPDGARALLAALDVAAVTAKLRDDVDDARSWRARTGLWLLRRLDDRARAALRQLGFPLSLFDELPMRQRRVEADPGAGIDALAAPTAELTGQLFAHAAMVSRRPELARSLAQLGAALGRFVYGLDAWLDRTRDARRGEFNAWRHDHGDRVDATTVAAWLGGAVAAARTALAGMASLDADDAAAARAVARQGDGPAGSSTVASTVDANTEVVELLSALLDSAAARVHAIAAPASSPRREAGECSVPCCEPDCGCCAAQCGEAAGAVESAATCPCCDACLCCDVCDRDRAAARRRRRASREPIDPDELDASTPELLVGRTVVAVTDLTPSGRVALGDLQFDARAEATLAAAGESLTVLRVRRGVLIVGRVDTSR